MRQRGYSESESVDMAGGPPPRVLLSSFVLPLVYFPSMSGRLEI